MENQYVYRKHLREPMKFLGAIYLFVLVVYALFVFIIMQASEFNLTALFIFIGAGLVLSVFIWIEFVLLYFFVFRRFSKISLYLTDDAIVYNNSKGQTIVPYEDIESLKFPSIQYTGGWIKIVHTSGNIRLTVVLESIGDFVKQLKGKLDNLGMDHKYKEKKLFNFYKTAKYSDHSWGRIYDYIKWIMLFMGVNVLAALVLAQFDRSGSLGFWFVISALVMPCICFVICEAVFGRKIARDTSTSDLLVPERNAIFEVKVFKLVFGIYSVIFLLIAVFALFS